ncbi:hypothetical protein RTH46_25310 [Pseudomonas sp. zfem004]|uniref:hypothetical protein n=1 Tax=unclassified Pseudomonas TaxID=196821 RepID=UPI00129A9F52|nr:MULTISPECIES: hypothetical protein [unclassified Pseudomonas]MDU9405804.1 hypothetical protein [Pseudomonas sp. zfem004]
MRKIATIALLAAASVLQVAYGQEPTLRDRAEGEAISPFAPRNAALAVSIHLASIGVPRVACPQGTLRSPMGLCQPAFDFD